MLGNEYEGGAVDGFVACTSQHIPREVVVASSCHGISHMWQNGMLLPPACLGLLACFS